jgi:TP901 family phage tail tape measure protein
MSAGAVRAGGVFVEIGADPRKFFSALTKVNKSLGNMGRSLASGGGRLAAAGIGMAAPIAAAVQQGAAFESTLLNIRASTGATAAQIDQIKASSMAMSQALGVGPTEAAQGMLELLKAGMSLDSVLGGAGRTALEFAKVGEMDVAQAAVVMSDAMNVFKVSSDVAANALSSAADASSTSIAQMSEAFSMSSAVAGKAGQSIEDLSATLAILANNGVKGSDAGTSVKTMLMRLMAPASEAADAMAGVGLSVRSFVNQDTGKMLPMVDIIGKLGEAMKPLDEVAKKELLAKIFGADAIRAALILGDVGTAGFEDMRKAMSSALPVGEKYKLLMSGLAGSAGNVLAALQRMAIAVSDAVAPALAGALPFITGFIDGLTKLATDNKEAVVLFAQVAAAAIGIGAAMVTVGYSLQALSGSIGLVLKGFGLFSALASPVLLVAAGIGAAVFALYKFKDQIGAALGPVAPLVQQAAGAIGEGFGAAVSDGIVVLNDLAATATTTFNGVYEAVAAGDLSGAMDVLWAGLVAGWLRGTEALMSYVDPWVAAFQDVFTDIGSGIYIAWDKIYTDSSAILNTMGAFIMGFFDNIANGVMATFDNLVAGIQIAWTRVQGYITGAEDTEQRVQAIRDENAARAEQRMQERPGIEERTAKSDEQNRQAEKDRKDREQAIKDDAQAAKNERQAENAKRADERRTATQAAEENVGATARKGKARRVMGEQFAELLKEVEGATSLDQLRDLYGQFDALESNGRLTSSQSATLDDALTDAQERISKATGSMSASPSEKAATAGAGAAGAESAVSMGSVAGTFSSLNLGSVFGGSSLAERTAKAAEETAKNTRKIDDGGKVAA